jgi:hypothetical protein
VIKYALEAMKKICKKYRYMFRSDNLYREMNYVIEQLSVHLLTQANVSIFTPWKAPPLPPLLSFDNKLSEMCDT